MNRETVLQFDDKDSDRSVILEDNGQVAYAYLRIAASIVGDVWLYNVASAPEIPDWSDRSKMPFLNPMRFCRTDIELPRMSDEVNIDCKWSPEGVEVFFDGVLTAKLIKGAKPGWSRLALKRGPLAHPLED